MKENKPKTNPQQGNKNSSPKHICPQCGADKVVPSRLQGGDAWRMRLLPKSPYRCLHCYHRFWNAESFFANSGRVCVWAILLSTLMVFLFGELYSFNHQAAVHDSRQTVQANIVNVDSNDSQPREAMVESKTDSKVQPVNSTQSEPVFTQNDFSESRLREVASRDEPLTPQQLEQQIAVAKQQAEQAKKDNEARQQRLKKSLSSAEDELQSLLKLDISYEVDQWKRAWEAGDSARYLSFYSKRFIPDSGISNEAWQAARRQRVTPSKKVNLSLRDYEVTFSNENTQSTINFTQDYTSHSYSDTVRKQLVLRKEWQRWKIISEAEISE